MPNQFNLSHINQFNVFLIPVTRSSSHAKFGRCTITLIELKIRGVHDIVGFDLSV